MVKRPDPKLPKRKKIIIYALTIILSVAYIYFGRQIALQGYPEWEDPAEEPMTVRVTEIVSDSVSNNERVIVFNAEVLHGRFTPIIIRSKSRFQLAIKYWFSLIHIQKAWIGAC